VLPSVPVWWAQLETVERDCFRDTTHDALVAAARAEMEWASDAALRMQAGWMQPGPAQEDGEASVGLRVFVEGRGEGTVRSFVKARFGTSEHAIDLDAKPGVVQRLALRRKGNDGLR
jgi:hypothetical protein